MLIDTHTHLYSEEFANDLEQVLHNAKNAGVEKFVLPAIDSKYHNRMKLLRKKYPNQVYLMMGLHPCYVKKETMEVELGKIKTEIFGGGYHAVGEIGIDLHWEKENLNLQIEAFERQIEWSIEKNLSICVHSRQSFDEVLDTLSKYKNRNIKGVIHCFSGDYSYAKKFLDMGFLLGIGGVLTYKKSGLVEVLKKIPIEKIVLETDAPYLAPTPHRGKRNESKFLVFVRDLLAKTKETTTEEIDEITSQNATKLFGLD